VISYFHPANGLKAKPIK